MKNIVSDKWCLVMYRDGDTNVGEVYYGETEKECLDVAEQHDGDFAIMKVSKYEFYDKEEA